MKACSRCSVTKVLEDFPPDKRRRDGRGSRCRQCHRAVSKESYQRNRERALAQHRVWRKANPAYYREWRARDPERRRAYAERRKAEDPERHKRYYRNNREKHAASVIAWREANPDKVRLYLRRSEAKRRAQRMALPSENIDPLVVFQRDAGICGICQRPVSPDDWHLDHVLPLARGGHHIYANVQVSHPTCNRRKGARMS